MCFQDLSHDELMIVDGGLPVEKLLPKKLGPAIAVLEFGAWVLGIPGPIETATNAANAVRDAVINIFSSSSSSSGGTPLYPMSSRGTCFAPR